jgi:alkylhydroperoxidase family enzyme
VISELEPLVALSPDGPGARINALVRRTCGRVLSLPPLAVESEADGPDSEAEAAVVDFAEQFSMDVTGVSGVQRKRLFSALGDQAFGAVVLTFIADFAPRVIAGLHALQLDSLPQDEPVWDHRTDPGDALFNGFLPAVARRTALDPVTAEIVRLRGADQHRCRLCNSRREANALEAGGSEDMYGDIASYDSSTRLSEAHKAALRYVDALVWSPANISSAVREDVRAHFSADAAAEITLDVMRNAANKILVALNADAPKVEDGTERYRIMADGSIEYE